MGIGVIVTVFYQMSLPFPVSDSYKFKHCLTKLKQIDHLSLGFKTF